MSQTEQKEVLGLDQIKELFQAVGHGPEEAEKLAKNFYMEVLLEALMNLSAFHDQKLAADECEEMTIPDLESKLAIYDDQEKTAAVAQASMSLGYDWLNHISDHLDEEQLDNIGKIIESFNNKDAK